jgi:competence protein ComEC
MKKAIIIVLLVSILMFGCLDFLGGKPAGTSSGTTSGTNTGTTTGQTVKNESTGVVITGETNKSIVHNETTGGTTVKPPGIQYVHTPELPFTVDFIYVGDETHQGDAILIKKGDADILIDAGPDKKGVKVNAFLTSRAIDDIELLISTHADPEHYSGIYAVADKYDIEEAWWMGNSFENSDYEALLSKLTTKKIPVKSVAKGNSITINGMKLEVLNPSKLGGAFKGTEGLDNDAIAVKITDRDFCLLLTSDILFGAQTYLQNNADVKCKIMQSPFHGLGTGNSQIGQLLIKVDPDDVIVSGGPSDTSTDPKGTRFSLYELLKLYKIDHYDNYNGKTVEITSDGTDYGIKYVG